MRLDRMIGRPGLATVLLALAVITANGPAADRQPDKPAGPRSPREELATFQILKGFRVELVACEPDVVDPVAMAFDEEGRIYVAEMRGYPNDGVGTGKITSGKIKRLEDRDGDGFYETSTIYAEGLRFPMGVMPYKGGLLVAMAPDIVYFEDTKHAGKADRQRTLYTGFALGNIQQMINGLQWGLDNWVYGVAGYEGGTITSSEKPDMKPVPLRGRGVRFHPDVPGSLEPTSGGGQYGLAADNWQNWFTATNSQHLRQIVLPDHYLRRNPYLPVSEVTIDIPDHGAACKLHRISPFESWRVERTTRRRAGPDAQRFPSTELVPGGYVTSACSPVVYTAELFPKEYRGNTFVCDPANNLIHRDVLVPNGPAFIAKRADDNCEFLASTDNWFRPVFLTIGPDGAIYVCDFYREVIETPLSLPDDIKAKLNLESRGRGRIWRIVPEKFDRTIFKKRRPALREESAEESVRHLEESNPWWRLTAQRLLVERQDRAVVAALQKMARESWSALGRVHALWTLHGLSALGDDLLEACLNDSDDGVREQVLRMAEDRLAKSQRLQKAVAKLARDPSVRLRFQVALTLGAADSQESVNTLAGLAREADDPWLQTAILISTRQRAIDVLEAMDHSESVSEGFGSKPMVFRLAVLVGAGAGDADLARAFRLVTRQRSNGWDGIRILQALGQGMQSSGRSLSGLWEKPPAALRGLLEKASKLLTFAVVVAGDSKQKEGRRAEAVSVLGYGPFSLAGPALQERLTPQNPSDLQLAAVRALSRHDHPKVSELLLAGWNGYSPVLRREVLEAIFARADRLPALLSAMEQQKVLAGQLEPFRLEQLRKHADAAIRKRAEKLLAGQIAADRQKVIDQYRSALELKADAGRGKGVFKRVCSTCHRLENVGTQVGADLMAALKTKTGDTLLIDILDPSREVDPRFINYIVSTKQGRTFTGMISADTASSITLRRAEGAEDTILRSQIEEIQATAKSVMPENLETQLSKQDLADVIGYLQSAVGAK